MADQPSVGGSGKGASGAATFFGNNGDTGTALSPVLIGVLAIGALLALGFVLNLLTKK